MATQYTAGITQGQAWTAAIANQIGAVWENWTPTITANTGTFTSVTLNMARYAQIQKIVICQFSATITNVGTGTNGMVLTVPITMLDTFTNGGSLGTWRENAVNGNTGVFLKLTTSSVRLDKYDNTAYVGTNQRYTGTFLYEAA